MKSSVAAAARGEIEHLARSGGDLNQLWEGAQSVLERAVPHYMGACFYTLDPTSLLITSHVNSEMPELPREWLELEYGVDDVNKLSDIARSDLGYSTLHEATGGDPSESPRWQANMRYGGDQELIAALRTSGGETWGALGLYREPGAATFDGDEIEFLLGVAPLLASGIKSGLLVGEALEPEWPDAPGMLVLDMGGELISSTVAAARWIDDLPGGSSDGWRLPTAVRAVSSRISEGGPEIAVARVLTESGGWAMIHGARLTGTRHEEISVIIEPAQPSRIVPLLMSAYGLTSREQEVARKILRGESTDRIANDLFVSPYTVQEHLKGIFEKTGVRSRRDLVGKIFFVHYEPRVRDNEKRALEGKAIRGGPAGEAPRDRSL